MKTMEYLSGPETLSRRELTAGVLREPPAPFYGHQRVVLRASVLLDAHVRAKNIGTVCVSPIDVVLDQERAIVLQPDLMVVTHARLGIIRNQIWGAPDLVVEVESRSSVAYDRIRKRRWYRQYGAREYWLIDPHRESLRVIRYSDGRNRSRQFAGPQRIASVVLPEFSAQAAHFFE